MVTWDYYIYVFKMRIVEFVEDIGCFKCYEGGTYVFEEV